MAQQVETFVENESVAGAVRTSMAGIANRKSFQNVRHMLVAQVTAGPRG